jgi:hypothetical protein
MRWAEPASCVGGQRSPPLVDAPADYSRTVGRLSLCRVFLTTALDLLPSTAYLNDGAGQLIQTLSRAKRLPSTFRLRHFDPRHARHVLYPYRGAVEFYSNRLVRSGCRHPEALRAAPCLPRIGGSSRTPTARRWGSARVSASRPPLPAPPCATVSRGAGRFAGTACAPMISARSALVVTALFVDHRKSALRRLDERFPGYLHDPRRSRSPHSSRHHLGDGHGGDRDCGNSSNSGKSRCHPASCDRPHSRHSGRI